MEGWRIEGECALPWVKIVVIGEGKRWLEVVVVVVGRACGGVCGKQKKKSKREKDLVKYPLRGLQNTRDLTSHNARPLAQEQAAVGPGMSQSK